MSVLKKSGLLNSAFDYALSEGLVWIRPPGRPNPFFHGPAGFR